MGRRRSFAEIKQKISDGIGFNGKADLTRPRREIRELEDPLAAVRRLYGEGRTYPRGRPPEQTCEPPIATPQWKGHSAGHGPAAGLGNEEVLDQLSPYYQLPQGTEDRLRFNYRNDIGDGWLRGSNEDATSKPFFDHSPKRGKERR